MVLSWNFCSITALVKEFLLLTSPSFYTTLAALINKLVNATPNDASHATLIHYWIDINTHKWWICVILFYKTTSHFKSDQFKSVVHCSCCKFKILKIEGNPKSIYLLASGLKRNQLYTYILGNFSFVFVHYSLYLPSQEMCMFWNLFYFCSMLNILLTLIKIF